MDCLTNFLWTLTQKCHVGFKQTQPVFTPMVIAFK